MCPREGIYDQPVLPAVLHTVLSFVPFLPLPMRYGLPLVLFVFDRCPPVFLAGLKPFHRMQAERAARYLARWEHGRWPLSLVYNALHALILVSFYQQPEIVRALEIDWESRATELVQLRGRLLSELGEEVGRKAG